jgi:recombination protein RecA
MSKKQDDSIVVEDVDIIPQLKKEINKKYETNVLINAQEIVDNERQVVSVSPALDIALGGGIPSGSWLLLSGTPKCGKSTLALQIAANAQKYGKDIFIGNVEHRLNKKEFQGIHNLDISKVHVIQSQKNKILMSQDFLQEFTNIIKTVANCVLIIDSSSALCAQNEYASDSTASFRNEGPKLLANFCRKNASVVPVQNIILIVISHLLANTSGYGSPFYEDGGNKLQYQGDIKLRCSSFQKWELTKGDESTRVGQVVTWNILTSSLGPPGGKVQTYLRYGYGIDNAKELIGLGLDFGIIEKNGPAWYVFSGEKFQGEEKLRNFLLENPAKLEELQQLINMHSV